MRSNEWISLLIAVIIGVLWIFLGQPYVFQHGFHTLLVGPGMNLQTFLRNGSSPGFTVFWAGCLSALLVWYFITFTSRTSQSSQVRSMRVVGNDNDVGLPPELVDHILEFCAGDSCWFAEPVMVTAAVQDGGAGAKRPRRCGH